MLDKKIVYLKNSKTRRMIKLRSESKEKILLLLLFPLVVLRYGGTCGNGLGDCDGCISNSGDNSNG